MNKFLGIFEREEKRLSKQLKSAETKLKKIKTDLASIRELISQTPSIDK